MKNNKLFLDDIRIPKDAINLVPTKFNKFYWENDWDIVRNYDEFIQYIEVNGVPGFVSFDHDLADFHYDFKPEDYENMPKDEMIMKFGSMEKTGLDCAKFLVEYCADENVPLPDYLVHSANPAGKENIEKFHEVSNKVMGILKNTKKIDKDQLHSEEVGNNMFSSTLIRKMTLTQHLGEYSGTDFKTFALESIENP